MNDMWEGEGALVGRICVFCTFAYRPDILEKFLIIDIIGVSVLSLGKRMAMSSAHPLGMVLGSLSVLVRRMSMNMLKSRGDRGHPCLIPLCMGMCI